MSLQTDLDAPNEVDNQGQEVQPTSKKIPLVECFGPTIQGEGAVIGQQTYFLRFGLCDYKCRMCDSMHAVDPHLVRANAAWLTQRQIFDKFNFFRASHRRPTTSWVTFSGGNPCIHNLGELVELMHSLSYSVQVETQGTFCPQWLEKCDAVCVSPKGPGIGEKLEIEKLDAFLRNLQFHSGLYLKFVVFDQRDLEVASMLYERYCFGETGQPRLRPTQFFLSLGNPWPPGVQLVAPGLQLHDVLMQRYRSLLDDIMFDRNLCNVRFLPQWHVLLYGNKQGV